MTEQSVSKYYFAILFAAKFGNCLSAEFLNLLPCEGFGEIVHASVSAFGVLLAIFGILWLMESESESCSVVSDSLRPHGLYSPWNSSGQNSRVGSLSLLQGIFPTQRWKPGLPHWGWILYHLNHRGSPWLMETSIQTTFIFTWCSPYFIYFHECCLLPIKPTSWPWMGHDSQLEKHWPSLYNISCRLSSRKPAETLRLRWVSQSQGTLLLSWLSPGVLF